MWDVEMNFPELPCCVGFHSSSKFFWRRRCGQHGAHMSVEAANGEAFPVCVYCDDPSTLPAGIMPASSYAQEADRLLRSLPSLVRLVTERKELNGTYGGFDFSALLCCAWGRRWLEVEVDGEGHFKCMYDTSAEQQQDADQRKDAASWQAGRCLLRLHFLDREEWPRFLCTAVELATQPTQVKLLLYTTSYDKPRRFAALQVSTPASRLAGGVHIGWQRWTHIVLHWIVVAVCV